MSFLRAYDSCLHIGLPKTATTLLQERLFPQHPDVAYLGKRVGDDRFVGRARDAVMGQVADLAIRRPFDPCDLKALRLAFDESVAADRRAGKLLVWSSEDLSVGSRRRRKARAERLRAVFGRCRVMLTVRHPVRLIESLYLQRLRGSLVGVNARIGARWTVPTVGAWLERNDALPERGALGHLDYAETLRIYREVFGEEAVEVVPFELLLFEPERFVRRFCTALEIDPESGIGVVAGQRRNDRWSQPELERLRALSRSRLGRVAFRFSPRALRRHFLPAVGQDAPRAKIELPAAWGARIVKETAPGHRWIAQTWGLPLEALGYPL